MPKAFPEARAVSLWWDFWLHGWKSIGKVHAKLWWVEKNLKIKVRNRRTGVVDSHWRSVGSYIPGA